MEATVSDGQQRVGETETGLPAHIRSFLEDYARLVADLFVAGRLDHLLPSPTEVAAAPGGGGEALA